MLRDFFAREEGQSLVEYAMIMLLVVIVVMGIVTVVGLKVSTNYYSQIDSGFPN